MLRFPSLFLSALLLASAVAPLSAATPAAVPHRLGQRIQQETGFLNRSVVSRGHTYRFQVYLPFEFRRDDRRPWPILLFLHGRGERGSEGMWQTQIGLPQVLRDHPDRWPFVVVMPQCPMAKYWTDPAMLEMAMATLNQEVAEFHTDPARTYLTGLSMGGYGAWELARRYPGRWAAVAIAAGGIFWSYEPERWQQASTLPAEYARAVKRTPFWIFHGTDDKVVAAKQSELMYEAIRAAGGRIRFWLFQGVKHDCWTRAYLEPELPRWFLNHRLESRPPQRWTPYAERQVVPLHPPAIKLSPSQLDALSGEYSDAHGRFIATLFHQGEQLYERNPQGETSELGAESASLLFYPMGSSITRILVERDSQSRIQALIYRDDRHEERWERKPR
jgi:poly(3-hydroxybutyrate) depolymerase